MSPAKEIAKESGVARSDVYRVMESLEKLGLVERAISAPCKYSAIRMEDALVVLVRRRKAETSELQANAREVIKKLKRDGLDSTVRELETEFVLIPAQKPFLNRVKAAIDGAQKTIDVLLSWRRFFEGLTSVFSENLSRSCHRYVQTRFIVENPPLGEAETALIESLGSMPHCQIRFVFEQPKVIMGIYDQKAITLVVNPVTRLSGSPALWSNSQSLITMAQDYFDMLWLTAKEAPKLEADN
jgi:sugar-specific transcriptional regulator TrmB